MSEHRSLPLRDVAKQGVYGAAGSTGVVLSIVHPVSLVTVIARRGKSKTVFAALKGLRSAQVMDAGFEQWFVMGQTAKALKTKLGGSASVIDQSHGRVVLTISGPKARAVLAKGTPVDIHADHFAIGQSAMTQMAHVGVHLTRTGTDEFTLSVFRGFSESFWEFLTASAGEFGYRIA